MGLLRLPQLLIYPVHANEILTNRLQPFILINTKDLLQIGWMGEPHRCITKANSYSLESSPHPLVQLLLVYLNTICKRNQHTCHHMLSVCLHHLCGADNHADRIPTNLLATVGMHWMEDWGGEERAGSFLKFSLFDTHTPCMYSCLRSTSCPMTHWTGSIALVSPS